MKNLIKRIYKSTQKNFDTQTEAIAWISLAASFFGLIISVVGILIAGTSIYLQFFDKKHSLYAVVSSYEIQNDEVTFGVVFNNQGDFTEVVTSGVITLREKPDPERQENFALEYCFQPITIESKKAIHRYYTVQFALSKPVNPAIDSEARIRRMEIEFVALSSENKRFQTSLDIGSITQNTLTSKIKELAIPTSTLAFNFSSKKTEELGTIHLGDDPKKDEPGGCRRKDDEVGSRTSWTVKLED